MQEYKQWAAAWALPYIREHVDLVGFWVDTDETPQVRGKALDELGSATVTWIIRWDDMTKRNEVMGKVLRTPERAGARSIPVVVLDPMDRHCTRFERAGNAGVRRQHHLQEREHGHRRRAHRPEAGAAR